MLSSALRKAGHDPGLFVGGRNATARTAYETLKAALADQATWTQRAAGAKELLAAMLGSRRQAAKLALDYDIRCAPAGAPGACRLPAPGKQLASSLHLLSSSLVPGPRGSPGRTLSQMQCARACFCPGRGVSGARGSLL